MVRSTSATAATKPTRRYVDARFGQVHLFETGDPHSAGPTLCCLHATAYSGQTFLPLMQVLASTGRHVMALDTPGYGGSDAPPSRVGFGDYAAALAEAIEATGAARRGPVDLFGYHTGALLATEIALLVPTRVRRLVLIGIPFFQGADKAIWREKLVHETRLVESFDQFRGRWDYFITHRTPGLSLERAFDCFVDELRAYPRDWWAHDALFDYAAEDRLPNLAPPTLVVNLNSALAPASRAAAALIPNCRLIDLPELGGAPFDLGAERLALVMTPFLEA